MKWGIIGLGNIANKFAKTLNIMNEELYAVASRDLSKAKSFKDEYNAKICYGSYLELINDNNVDVIYIATPNNMHFDIAIEALRHNKNVLCEKPLTTNHILAKKLYDYAKNNNIFIMEALWIYFLPLYKKLKELLPKIGNIKEINVSYGFDTNEKRKARKFDSNLAGGALLDIGVYNLGFITMILGFDIIDIKSNYHLNEYNTDDYEEITLKYKNNIIAKSITQIGKDIKREAYIKGDMGTIYIPDFQAFEMFYLNDEKYESKFDINGFEYQILEVINSIKENRNESKIYNSTNSIKLMKLLYDIRMSWNMKFNFEK